jgi:dephospho-CoA kinase
MKLVGIVGMPGSGKSELFKSAEFADFEKFDDVLANKNANEQRIRELIKTGKSVLVSDIEFCDAEWREIFERNVGG